jgi:pimeloyl-ACP methyl ester carboxylesterase
VSTDDYGRRGKPDWREVNWREHLHQVEVGGRSVNYCDYGDGPPVLLVHGIGGCWQNWIENVRAIGRSHRVIAPDLPGSGFSEMPADEISIPGYARAMAELCERLGIERVPVVGHSLGGFVSAALAIERPDLVERLVLVSAAGFTIHDVNPMRVMAWGRINMAFSARLAADAEPFVRRRRLRHLAFSTMVRYPSRVPQEDLYELGAGTGRPGFMAALKAMQHDFRERVESIRCPTLIVCGANDMTVPPRDSERYEQAIPNARKVVFEDTGHIPHMERAPAFNALVEQFLAAERPLEAATA